MQNMDRMRRRQIVAQMPPQIFVPAYKRMELKEEWQRELEFAFEDMYSEDRSLLVGYMSAYTVWIPPAVGLRCSSLLSSCPLNPKSPPVTLSPPVTGLRCSVYPVIHPEPRSLPVASHHEEAKTHQPQSKLALKKLLNKIRNQKEEWTSKNEKEIQSEIETIESGTIASEERPLCDLKLNYEQQKNTACEASGM
ncbi:CE295 protein, partial [Corythaeola cristata]|nr:CE295 protein [Corythaeola cristata]